MLEPNYSDTGLGCSGAPSHCLSPASYVTCCMENKKRMHQPINEERIFFFNLNRYWKQSQTSDSSPDEFLNKGSIDTC